MLTYEAIRNAMLEEKKSNKLTELPENFFQEALVYLESKEKMKETKEDAWLNLTFVGIDFKTSENEFYADSGFFTRKADFVTNTSVQKVIASWTVSDTVDEKVYRRTAVDGTTGLNPPFWGGTYSSLKIQLLYLQSEIKQYGIIDKICFQCFSSNQNFFYK